MAQLAESQVDVVRAGAISLQGIESGFDKLIDAAAHKRYVLIGEASHGTDEFYRARAAITRRLIEEHGFDAVAAEADWPDAYRVDRFVRGGQDDDALAGFERFPAWMWRNTVVRDFAAWLRARNDAHDPARRAGFYGLDLYSLRSSMHAVLGYLAENDPDGARRARSRYGCFDHFGENPQGYGYAASFGLKRSCEDAVVEQLIELRARRAMLVDGVREDDEAYFYAEQNARLVVNAEEYYRSMFRGRVSSWNLRDSHMMETFEALGAHLARRGRAAKIVVWAHNSHLGDARATEMGQSGELNLGQLVRQKFPGDCLLVGFSTDTGTVTAAEDWDEPARKRRVLPGYPGSYEQLFHRAGGDFMLDLGRAGEALTRALRGPLLQRAIGVIYRPETERQSHYALSDLPRQFDWMLHIDRTSALEPLDPPHAWRSEDPPETYPSGL